MPLSYSGSKLASAVGAGNVVWIFDGRQWGQVRHLPPLSGDLLHLAGLRQDVDESLVLLLPVVLSGWCFTLRKGKVVRELGPPSASTLKLTPRAQPMSPVPVPSVLT